MTNNQTVQTKSEFTKRQEGAIAAPAGKLRKVSEKERLRRLEENRLALRRAREANLDKWAGKSW